MKNKIIFIIIILLVFMILLIPLKGSYAFYSDSKDLNIINTKVGNFSKTELEKYLRSNDENHNLSKYIVGDMYRYQGTDNVANWICFGTTENCGTNDELIDKYMYRIIGITTEGQLKLLKETFIKEGNTTTFRWNLKNDISDCLGETCEWPNADLYKRINGASNGTTPGSGSYSNNADTDIFVDNEYYDYLKSGDNVNGTKDEKGSSWYQLIENHDWMYSDTKETKYDGNEMYKIETGKTATTRYWPDEGTQTTCSNDSLCTEKEYIGSKSIAAKIGLMYMYDVLYAYPGGNPGSEANVVKSWIHFQKDGSNLLPECEWLITRFGVYKAADVSVDTRSVRYNGSLWIDMLNYTKVGARPVFYLNSNVMIIKGNGTRTNPFIIN